MSSVKPLSGKNLLKQRLVCVRRAEPGVTTELKPGEDHNKLSTCQAMVPMGHALPSIPVSLSTPSSARSQWQTEPKDIGDAHAPWSRISLPRSRSTLKTRLVTCMHPLTWRTLSPCLYDCICISPRFQQRPWAVVTRDATPIPRTWPHPSSAPDDPMRCGHDNRPRHGSMWAYPN